jgi:hypothetical protein
VIVRALHGRILLTESILHLPLGGTQ